MTDKSKKQSALSPQSKLFIRTANEFEADSDEKTFDKTLGKIAKAPPPKKTAPKKGK